MPPEDFTAREHAEAYVAYTEAEKAADAARGRLQEIQNRRYEREAQTVLLTVEGKVLAVTMVRARSGRSGTEWEYTVAPVVGG